MAAPSLGQRGGTADTPVMLQVLRWFQTETLPKRKAVKWTENRNVWLDQEEKRIKTTPRGFYDSEAVGELYLFDAVHIGRWFVSKWRSRLREATTFTVALQMKKQGIPIELALLALVGRKL